MFYHRDKKRNCKLWASGTNKVPTVAHGLYQVRLPDVRCSRGRLGEARSSDHLAGSKIHRLCVFPADQVLALGGRSALTHALVQRGDKPQPV